MVTNTRTERSHPAPTPDANCSGFCCGFPQTGGRTTVTRQHLCEPWQHPLISTVVIMRKYVSVLSFPVHVKNKAFVGFSSLKGNRFIRECMRQIGFF